MPGIEIACPRLFQRVEPRLIAVARLYRHDAKIAQSEAGHVVAELAEIEIEQETERLLVFRHEMIRTQETGGKALIRQVFVEEGDETRLAPAAFHLKLMAARQVDQVRLRTVLKTGAIIAGLDLADKALRAQLIKSAPQVADFLIGQVARRKHRLLAVAHADIEALRPFIERLEPRDEGLFFRTQHRAINRRDKADHLAEMIPVIERRQGDKFAGHIYRSIYVPSVGRKSGRSTHRLYSITIRAYLLPIAAQTVLFTGWKIS